MHPSLHFKFMDILAGCTNNKVLGMSRYLESSDYGMIYLMISSVPCDIDGIVRYNHADALQGYVGFFIVKIRQPLRKKCLPKIPRGDSIKLHGHYCANFVDTCRR